MGSFFLLLLLRLPHGAQILKLIVHMVDNVTVITTLEHVALLAARANPLADASWARAGLKNIFKERKGSIHKINTACVSPHVAHPALWHRLAGARGASAQLHLCLFLPVGHCRKAKKRKCRMFLSIFFSFFFFEAWLSQENADTDNWPDNEPGWSIHQ